MDAADMYYYTTNPDVQSAVPHITESDKRQSAWERRGGNPPFRMQVVRRRRCEKRRRRYQHSEKIEVLTWLEDFRVPRRPFDSRFLREEDDIDDPDFRRPTVIEAAKYFDIPRESIMNWRKQRSRLLPSTPQPMSPPDTPSLTVASMLNNDTTGSAPPLAESYERTRKILSITSLCNAHDSPDVQAATLPTPEPTPSPLIPTQKVHGLVPGDICIDGAWANYSRWPTPTPDDLRR